MCMKKSDVCHLGCLRWVSVAYTSLSSALRGAAACPRPLHGACRSGAGPEPFGGLAAGGRGRHDTGDLDWRN